MVAICHHGFLKVQIFNGQYSGEGQLASSCQMSRRSVKPLWRYDDLSFFNMAAVCHLGVVVRVIGKTTKGIWWSLLLCKIWLESMQNFR